MASVLSAKHYHDEDEAFAYVERHLWPAGPVCAHCGETVRVGRMGGKATRKGLHKCYKCRKQFTVRQGTLFESSHLPLHIWLQAIYLIEGVVVVETLFGIPGIGHALVHAVIARDVPMVQGTALAMGLLFVAITAAVDLACHWLDPRPRRT